MSIIQGKATSLAYALRSAGQVVALDPASSIVTAQLLAEDGSTALSSVKTVSAAAAGSNWPAGVVMAQFTSSETSGAAPPAAIVAISATVGEASYAWSIPVAVDPISSVETALFTRSIDVPRLRALAAAQNNSALPDFSQLSDDELWFKLQVGEQYVSALLPGIPLEPTEFFCVDQPTQQDLASIGSRPYEVDSGYDLPFNFFDPDVWGGVKLRNFPVSAVNSAWIEYPSLGTPVFNIPPSWISFDPKTGYVNIVPGPQGYTMPVGIFAMTALTAGSTVPQMLRIRYTAGLDSSNKFYAAVVDLARRVALYGTILDGFPMQSGSISADGLSESVSVDLGKYKDAIDGQAGLLRDRLCGVNGGIFATL